ncbi:MAG: amidohydrolase [Deltaproteobacteria bacterium]|nr:amidohydrolase [Deltaproteobacteria bacterium]
MQQRTMPQTTRTSYEGVIDADGHINEPHDLWEKYIDPRFRDRAIHVGVDADGRERMQVGGKPSRYLNADLLARGRGMGLSFEDREALTRIPYKDSMPFGASDPKERVQLLDYEGLQKAFIYPTISLEWESEVTDLELAAAYCRAYNRWVVDFCADSAGRLVPIAHVSLSDGQVDAEELERAVKAGCKGVFLAPYTITDKPHGDKMYDRFWAVAQDHNIPVAIHPVAEPPNRRVYQRFREMYKWGEWWVDVLGGQGPQQAFLALFQYGLFDRFPKVKVVILESGAGWIGHMLDRMDAAWTTPLGRSIPLKEKPSYYFQRQCWISADPDERALSYLVEFLGHDKFFWATDYPHDDHTLDYIKVLDMLVAPMSDRARRGILGENVARVYGV